MLSTADTVRTYSFIKLIFQVPILILNPDFLPPPPVNALVSMEVFLLPTQTKSQIRIKLNFWGALLTMHFGLLNETG